MSEKERGRHFFVHPEVRELFNRLVDSTMRQFSSVSLAEARRVVYDTMRSFHQLQSRQIMRQIEGVGA